MWYFWGFFFWPNILSYHDAVASKLTPKRVLWTSQPDAEDVVQWQSIS
jgi:hypothetical protein